MTEKQVHVVAGVLGVLGFVSVILISVFKPGVPPDPQMKWAANLNDKCKAMGGDFHFDRQGGEANCYRHPIGRKTMHLFTERYK